VPGIRAIKNRLEAVGHPIDFSLIQSPPPPSPLSQPPSSEASNQPPPASPELAELRLPLATIRANTRMKHAKGMASDKNMSNQYPFVCIEKSCFPIEIIDYFLDLSNYLNVKLL
jgi:hypothetical protein